MAASTKERMTLGPAKFAAACAPTEKMPAPTATATPMSARSQVPRLRLRLRSSSPASAIDASTDFTRQSMVASSLEMSGPMVASRVTRAQARMRRVRRTVEP